MRSVHLKITGKVQGVFFRASAQKQALELHLTGWVRNSGDFVEAVVSGSGTDVAFFIEWAHIGPERARVQQVEVTEMPYQDFKEFVIKRE